MMNRRRLNSRPIFTWAAAACALAALLLAAVGCAPQAAPQGETPLETQTAVVPPTMKMTTEIPASITASDSAETSIGTLEYFDGVPKKETVENVYDYLDRSRAVNVYLNSIPALSINALREGQASAGCAESHQVCIFDTLMDSKSLFLTGNTSTMYAVGFLDLTKDGPTVVDLPTGMLGILDDMAFLYMTDLGVAGPDKGKGGKFLVLPLRGMRAMFRTVTLSCRRRPMAFGSSCAATSTKGSRPHRRTSGTT